MPQTCTLCKHPRRNDIDRALLAGESFRHIASQFGTSTGALQRHKADHLPKKLMKAHEAKEVLSADSLLSDVRNAEGRAERLYGAAVRHVIEPILLQNDDLDGALGVPADMWGYMTLTGPNWSPAVHFYGNAVFRPEPPLLINADYLFSLG